LVTYFTQAFGHMFRSIDQTSQEIKI
jgi:hypothetical protein